jgi:hypothetical protein
VSACLQAAGNALAANGLAALQLNATPDCAAGLLKRIGWWDPHAQMALLRLGVTPDFGSRLQVRVSHTLSRGSSPPLLVDSHRRAVTVGAFLPTAAPHGWCTVAGG